MSVYRTTRRARGPVAAAKFGRCHGPAHAVGGYTKQTVAFRSSPPLTSLCNGLDPDSKLIPMLHAVYRPVQHQQPTNTHYIMSNIYSDALDRVVMGIPYSIDFEKRELRLDGKRVPLNTADLGIDKASSLEACLSSINRRFDLYRHSIPSERTDRKRRLYFHALPQQLLTTEDWCSGVSRLHAMFSLEFYILASIINGSLYWDEQQMHGTFHYQVKYPDGYDLVLLRKWIDPASPVPSAPVTQATVH